MLYKSPNEKEQIITSNDNLVIQKYVAGVPGGRTLDVSGWTEDKLPAGLVIVSDAEGVCKPLAITDGKYGTLPTGSKYVGVLTGTLLKTDPRAAIMTIGVVNSECLPAPLPEGFLATITTVSDTIA